MQTDATLAQSAEQLIRNEQVVGSIPTGGFFDEALSHLRQAFFIFSVSEVTPV
jgi:hypothetical protein